MTYLPSCENLKRNPLLYVEKAGRNQEPPPPPPATCMCVRVNQALVFLDGQNDNFLPFDCVESQLFAAAL